MAGAQVPDWMLLSDTSLPPFICVTNIQEVSTQTQGNQRFTGNYNNFMLCVLN